jgi:phage terminase Nu1 subunit (DNA packaging protein)
MPTHRPQLAELSTSDLAYLARRKLGSVRRQLEQAGLRPVREDGRTLWWSGREAFRVLTDRGPDATAQKARFDAARADAQELRNAQVRGELIPAADVDKVMIALATTASARLQALPARLARELAAEASPAGCQEILDRAVRSALEDLADEGARALERSKRLERRARGRR